MNGEVMKSDEVRAVKELIEKLPPEDLEKAVGGMSQKKQKILKAAGILGATVLTVGYLKRDRIKEMFHGGDEAPAVSTNYCDYYDKHWWRPNTLKDGFKEVDGVIYQDTGIATSAFNDYVHDVTKKYGKDAIYDKTDKNVFVSLGVRVDDLTE